jgi:hypothetical protein
MTISIKQNRDNTITVSCGNESVTIGTGSSSTDSVAHSGGGYSADPQPLPLGPLGGASAYLCIKGTAQRMLPDSTQATASHLKITYFSIRTTPASQRGQAATDELHVLMPVSTSLDLKWVDDFLERQQHPGPVDLIIHPGCGDDGQE